MRLLLDTHAYLWALSGTPRLGPRARALIADRANDVFVSVVSLWEIVLKAAKLRADIPTVLQSVEPSGFASLPLGVRHLERLFELGGLFDDPFDRLLVAQADCEHLTLVTEDATIQDHRFVNLIECRTGRLLRAKRHAR